MFDNIGGKIKTVAQTICWIGIALSIIIGLTFISQGDDRILIGLLIAVIGSISSWLGSFMTYAFGQLVENSDILVANVEQIDKQNGFMHKTVYTCARELITRLPNKENNNKANSAGQQHQPSKPANAALEEMRTYKALLDDGIISQEEFIARTNELIEQ